VKPAKAKEIERGRRPGVLRAEEEGELRGLDLFEHGIPAHPAYLLHSAATPHGAHGGARGNVKDDAGQTCGAGAGELSSTCCRKAGRQCTALPARFCRSS
jgi:hypothetical protein